MYLLKTILQVRYKMNIVTCKLNIRNIKMELLNAIKQSILQCNSSQNTCFFVFQFVGKLLGMGTTWQDLGSPLGATAVAPFPEVE